jgi:AbrB family looped-hinge helix DNA binding protein
MVSGTSLENKDIPTALVDARGRLTIPASLRKELGIVAGTKIRFKVLDDQKILLLFSNKTSLILKKV